MSPGTAKAPEHIVGERGGHGPSPAEVRVDLAQLEEEARTRLPRGVYDWAAGGAGDEVTLAANVESWTRIRLRPHVLRGIDVINAGTTALGIQVSAPILVAPSGYHGLVHPLAEGATASGAAAMGTVVVLSMASTLSLEAVADVAPTSKRWFQLLIRRDRGLTLELVARARAAGFQALMLTVDSGHRGPRRRDLRNGFMVPADILGGNLSHARDNGSDASVDPTISLDDLDWLRGATDLPLVVKGVLRGDDALACVQHGATAIVVSNHGGRQLDGVIATADALPNVVEAVGDASEVYVDGGIRRGSDILKALALGARAALVGRPILWGLTISGADGVAAVLHTLQDELLRAMGQCGVATVSEITRDIVCR